MTTLYEGSSLQFMHKKILDGELEEAFTRVIFFPKKRKKNYVEYIPFMAICLSDTKRICNFAASAG